MTKKPAAKTFFDGRDRELGEAIEAGDVERIRQSAAGLELSQPRRHDMTFLFFAMVHEQEPAVKELIRLGADPAIAVSGLGSPLGTAIRSDDDRWLRVLLEAGVNANTKDASEEPLVFGSVEAPNIKTLSRLHQAGANLDARDALDATAMYAALKRRKFEHVEYLIKSGADVHFSTVNGVTMGNAIERQLGRAKPDTPLAKDLLKIKRLLESRGFLFPADPIEVVREKRKLAGKRVVE
ncbi:Ankyrin repeats (3 copies) [Novipirellula aureliae]|uniref:Ankyrin repeats (3 copies) n=1 Tax=Novipirellula aureliae TaxID=2527966 RepID=A0A5C6E871_9BACT|nr:hypothetical protein [Novipirellula aureliae]TWU45008.1 Ankyrin repeats (3 copies) [Novipirellula aureliae]